MRTHELGKKQAEIELAQNHIKNLKNALIRLTNEAERRAGVPKSEIDAARAVIDSVSPRDCTQSIFLVVAKAGSLSTHDLKQLGYRQREIEKAVRDGAIRWTTDGRLVTV